MRALLSVYDKSGIVEFGKALVELGWELVSTGGTFAALEKAGLDVTKVESITGFPEILDGRVKTLHPAIHGGLLGRLDNATDAEQLATHEIELIELLAVNLYPFERTVQNPGASRETIIENIDIGGPAMIRAAAKNHAYVIPVCDPADYDQVIKRLAGNAITLEFRQALAAKAFAHTSAYDSLVAEYLGDPVTDVWPDTATFAGRKRLDLRYGENPHQSAAAYQTIRAAGKANGLLAAEQLHGKELSYNNLLDGDAAWRAVQHWTRPAVAIVKHTIPCGFAIADDLDSAFELAVAGDPVSAFGGIVASNRVIDLKTAQRMQRMFFEIVLAPSFDDNALELLASKKNLRLMQMGATSAGSTNHIDIRSIEGGLLVQQLDSAVSDSSSGWQVHTHRRPTEAELGDLEVAWRICALVKSNAIVLVRNKAVVGVGSGQPNRVESVKIASRLAGERAIGAAMASDAFFPFADGLEAAADAGVTSVVQPGGSRRDSEVIEAANAADIAMLFTGTRHFKH